MNQIKFKKRLFFLMKCLISFLSFIKNFKSEFSIMTMKKAKFTLLAKLIVIMSLIAQPLEAKRAVKKERLSDFLLNAKQLRSLKPQERRKYIVFLFKLVALVEIIEKKQKTNSISKSTDKQKSLMYSYFAQLIEPNALAEEKEKIDIGNPLIEQGHELWPILRSKDETKSDSANYVSTKAFGTAEDIKVQAENDQKKRILEGEQNSLSPNERYNHTINNVKGGRSYFGPKGERNYLKQNIPKNEINERKGEDPKAYQDSVNNKIVNDQFFIGGKSTKKPEKQNIDPLEHQRKFNNTVFTVKTPVLIPTSNRDKNGSNISIPPVSISRDGEGGSASNTNSGKNSNSSIQAPIPQIQTHQNTGGRNVANPYNPLSVGQSEIQKHRNEGGVCLFGAWPSVFKAMDDGTNKCTRPKESKDRDCDKDSSGKLFFRCNTFGFSPDVDDNSLRQKSCIPLFSNKGLNDLTERCVEATREMLENKLYDLDVENYNKLIEQIKTYLNNFEKRKATENSTEGLTLIEYCNKIIINNAFQTGQYNECKAVTKLIAEYKEKKNKTNETNAPSLGEDAQKFETENQ